MHSGKPGYIKMGEKYIYFILHQEIIDGTPTGCYLKEYISKEQYDKLQGERDAKTNRAKI